MVPSVFALLVLGAGLVLIHFGVKDIESVLGTITYTPTPFVNEVTTSPGEAIPGGGKQ